MVAIAGILVIFMFILIECFCMGLLVTGVILTIMFIIMSRKEKIGNKIAIPICLITFGISGLFPTVYFILIYYIK